MSNLRKAFDHGKAFVAFITCGDPDLETTAKAVRAMAEGGADLIELGIPFSDPTAEGPVIQSANVRALSAGTTTDKIFEMVKTPKRREDSDGFHDLCKCSFFLWNRAICRDVCTGWNGWSDSSGCSV